MNDDAILTATAVFPALIALAGMLVYAILRRRQQARGTKEGTE
jgi:hypothetical protein